jgi:hypothetical protein
MQAGSSNFHCRRVLSNLCLYSFKHLVHPIFCYDSSFWLIVKFLHLIDGDNTILTQVYENGCLILQAHHILVSVT